MPLRRPTIFATRFASLAAKLSLRAKIFLALALPVALLVHAGILGVRSVDDLRSRDRQQLEHADTWHTASQEFLAHVNDANARMGAYAATGRAEYLKEYRTLEESISPAIRKLRLAGAKRTQNLTNHTEQFFDALAALIPFAPFPGSNASGPPEQQIEAARKALEQVRADLSEI